LATVGVLLTAGITGGFALLAFALPPLEAFLIGAIVASTDAAAAFSLLRTSGFQLKQRVGTTLEIESGANDPVAVFLTVALVGALMAPHGVSALQILAAIVEQAAFGAILGGVGGLAISLLINRLDLASGLQPLFTLASAVLIFALTAVVGGSGFLAVYLAGLVVGNRPLRAFAGIMSFSDAATWFCQIVMFLVLGLLMAPARMVHYALPALAVALSLMMVARPISAWLCLLPFRFSWRETSFIAWVGLRGAVSIFLASIPMLSGLPGAELYLNIAFTVVVASLLVQGWTVATTARWLDVALPRVRHPVRRVELDLPGQVDYELAGYLVPSDSPILRHAAIPIWARLVLVVRQERVLAAAEAGALKSGDHVYLLTPSQRAHLLDRLFAAPDEIDEADRGFFGEFVFPGELSLSKLGELYGLPVPPGQGKRSLAEHFLATVSEHPVVGDWLLLGASELIVRDVEGDRITQVGLRIERVVPQHPILKRIAALLQRI
jgi:cell volume regulation protein A